MTMCKLCVSSRYASETSDSLTNVKFFNNLTFARRDPVAGGRRPGIDARPGRLPYAQPARAGASHEILQPLGGVA